MSKKQENTEKDQFPTSSDRMSEGGQSPQVRIVTWRPDLDKADFYIQSKGLHAGRPLDKPIANCWAVYSDIKRLKGIAYSIYISGFLKQFSLGTVIPFIRLSEYRPLLLDAAKAAADYDEKHLETIEFLRMQIDSLKTKLLLFEEFQSLLGLKVNQDLKIFERHDTRFFHISK